MELKTAIEILEYHQEWRLGKREDMIHEPKKLTEALDVVLNEVKLNRMKKDELTTNAGTEQVAPPDAYTLLPAVLLDNDGYPTEEWLQFIKSYKPDESLPLLTFVEMVLVDGWYMSDWGFKLHKKYKDKCKLELHTGGWSGNEETIAAIKSNMWLTHFQMRYVMWRTGGHYYFELYVG